MSTVFTITERRIASGHPKCMFVLYRESDHLPAHVAFSTGARSHENSTHQGCVASKAPAACEDQFRPPKTFADELALEETQKGSRNV